MSDFKPAAPSSLKRASTRTAERVLPPISRLVLSCFTWYSRRYLMQHFHALRISRDGSAPQLANEPILFYLNHPSWWDPLVGLAVAERYFANYANYAPMDSAQLQRYRFFERLGFFGISPGTVGGARRFLAFGTSILKASRQALWVTAAGEFTDPRVRPVVLRSGISHLACRAEGGWAVPLAIEYPFWNERLPEILVRFGEPISLREQRSLEGWHDALTQGLEVTQDALRLDALSRSPDPFHTILKGTVGIGGVYDWTRQFSAWCRGQTFQRGHGSERS